MHLRSIADGSIPFALKHYLDCEIEAQAKLSEKTPEHDSVAWSWAPANQIGTEQLEIYASGNRSTSRQTMQGRWDHSEFD
jgi:hypothetical protein